MSRNPHPSGSRRRRVRSALAVVALLAIGGCAAQRAGTPPTPAEVYRSLLGRNPGLTAVRAVAEARLSFAGHQVSLPGVLQLDSLGGFRLDLLDPLDRPLAILFADGGRIVHYRPVPGLAASLGVFPDDCRGNDPSDWVSALLAASLGPIAGESLVDSNIWGSGRILERHRGTVLRQSIRYTSEAGLSLPRLISWYCAEEPVLQLKFDEWVQAQQWRLPSRFEIVFLKAGLVINIELSEIETNPPSSRQPFRPPLGPEIRWTAWNLPQ